MRVGETYPQYQARLGTPVQAIDFALTLDDGFEMREFLVGWQHGDVEEWPAYQPAPARAAERPVPRALYMTAAGMLLLVAWLALEVFCAGVDMVTGFILASIIAIPAALLLHAGGVKAPRT